MLGLGVRSSVRVRSVRVRSVRFKCWGWEYIQVLGLGVHSSVRVGSTFKC